MKNFSDEKITYYYKAESPAFGPGLNAVFVLVLAFGNIQGPHFPLLPELFYRMEGPLFSFLYSGFHL
jgi:hypothetical protein